jgi:hypothetical protein
MTRFRFVYLKSLSNWNFYRFFNSQEQSLFIMSTDDGYRLVKTRTKDATTERLKADVKWHKPGDFLSHGANVLLQRKAVLEGFKGCLQAYCCDINGEFALCQQWVHKAERKLLVGEIMPTKRIDQLMIYDDDRMVKVTSFFSLKTGRMLRRAVTDVDHFTHINPLSDEEQYKKNLLENWEKDIELMLKYLEFKAKRKSELKAKFETPHVQQALRNYIGTLIKSKPQNVMNFTIEFLKKLERNSKNVKVQIQILETANRRHQHKSMEK